MKKGLILCLSFLTLPLLAQENIQWRGTDRTGIYKEQGLLKSWPENGPELLWHYDQLGQGYSSVAVVNQKIYATGAIDGKGTLFVFDTTGKVLNKAEYSPEWNINFHGSRCTVSASDEKLYIYSGTGDLVCLDEADLKVRWTKSIINDLGGENLRFGINESPLIVDDKVIITPGKKNNVVALNKNTGDIIWTCAGEGDLAAYCSPLYLSDQQVPQIVTITGKHVLGVNAKTGEKLWSFPYHNDRDIHPNTPVYGGDNMLLCIFGYGKGSVMLRLTDGGRKVEQAWENKEFDSKMGGAVKLGNYVYASGDHNKYWFCLDWKTGEQKYKDRTIGVGNVIAADNMLYCYSEKGEMALVKATPEKFDLVSQFPVTLGTEQHWAHPVLYKGVMYVRHGNTLMAYKVK